MAEDKIRLFLAISLAETYQHEIRKLINAFESYSNQVKWVDDSHVHLTIHFFGSIESGRLESIKILFRNLALRFGPFDLYLKNLGAFPNLSRPRVIWVGLDGDLRELQDLKEACDLELVRIGYPIEEREFKPHLTLGRIREGQKINLNIPGHLQNYFSEQKHHVKEIILFKSELSPKGPVYTALEKFPLQG